MGNITRPPAAAAILSLFFLSCEAPGRKTPNADHVSLAAPPVEWGVYAETVGWVSIVNRHTNLEITVESKPGAMAVQEAVASGYNDLGYHQLYSETSLNFSGKGRYRDKSWSPARNLRLLIGGISQLNATFMTGPRTGIHTMHDLQGKRVPISAWNDIDSIRGPLLRAYGYDSETDLSTVLINTSEEGWSELQLGRMDVLWDAINEHLLEVQESVGQIVFLSVEPEKLNRAKASHPDFFKGIYPVTVEQGDIPGLTIPQPVRAVAFTMMVFANENLPDSVAHTIVLALVEHAAEVREIAGTTRGFSKEQALPPVDIVGDVPYHAGALRAFQELGLWTEAHENQQQLLVSQSHSSNR